MLAAIIGLIAPATAVHKIIAEDNIDKVWPCCTFGLGCEKPRNVSVPADMFGSACWVAYSPTNYSPDGREPNEADVRTDLKALKDAGFSGLVTYTSRGTLGRKFPKIAMEAGFTGLIMGIWDPLDVDEFKEALSAADSDILHGFVVGNEGLGRKGAPSRYTMCQLQERMYALRRKTNKPVTTSEDSDAYENIDVRNKDEVLNQGDWLFPNAHPYSKGVFDPTQAVEWTRVTFRKLSARANVPVVFKEVGLPTAADNGSAYADEMKQSEYYENLYGYSLPEDRVDFVYFEAFDQAWKGSSVERSWGLFRADRGRKEAVNHVCKTPTRDDGIETVAVAAQGNDSPGARIDADERPDPPANRTGETSSVRSSNAAPFYVYRDGNMLENRFMPTGFMGDIGDLSLDENSTDRPYRGRTAFKITYVPRGASPNECGYPAPCRWAGVRWQYPAGNFGQMREGHDLQGFSRLRFVARADSALTVKFLVGGIPGRYPDSIVLPIEYPVSLTSDWREHVIDLRTAKLSHVIGGFGVVLNWPDNGIQSSEQRPYVFHVDEVRFER